MQVLQAPLSPESFTHRHLSLDLTLHEDMSSSAATSVTTTPTSATAHFVFTPITPLSLAPPAIPPKSPSRTYKKTIWIHSLRDLRYTDSAPDTPGINVYQYKHLQLTSSFAYPQLFLAVLQVLERSKRSTAAAVAEIHRWPDPRPNTDLDLRFLGSKIRLSIPLYADMPILGAFDEQVITATETRAAWGPGATIDGEMYSVYEAILLGRQVTVVSKDQDLGHAMVEMLKELVRPVRVDDNSVLWASADEVNKISGNSGIVLDMKGREAWVEGFVYYVDENGDVRRRQTTTPGTPLSVSKNNSDSSLNSPTTRTAAANAAAAFKKQHSHSGSIWRKISSVLGHHNHQSQNSSTVKSPLQASKKIPNSESTHRSPQYLTVPNDLHNGSSGTIPDLKFHFALLTSRFLSPLSCYLSSNETMPESPVEFNEADFLAVLDNSEAKSTASSVSNDSANTGSDGSSLHQTQPRRGNSLLRRRGRNQAAQTPSVSGSIRRRNERSRVSTAIWNLGLEFQGPDGGQQKRSAMYHEFLKTGNFTRWVAMNHENRERNLILEK